MYVTASLLSTKSVYLPTQIKDQHSAYLRKELTAMRDRYIADTRIHCCLFFISPTGHTLKPVCGFHALVATDGAD
jgi:septin family protein